MQNNFIAGRTFQDTADLKRQLNDWMINYANQRVHGTTRKVPFFFESFAVRNKQLCIKNHWVLVIM